MKPLSVALIVGISGCASMDYQPVQERSFEQFAAEGCRDDGTQLLVTAQVSKAYENTAVLWDGRDPRSTVAVTVPGRGVLGRVRGWFGEDKQEVTAETLNQLAAERVPVTFGLECQGDNIAAQIRSVRYTDSQGQRVAIGY